MSQSNANNFAEKFSKNTIIKLFACVGLAVFWVVFLWNFWDREVYALGINALVFFALFLGFFIWVLFEKGRCLKKDTLWIVPLSLMIVSFFLYDNPFVKVVTLLVGPVSFFVFYNYSFLKDRREKSWNLSFALSLFIGRLVAIFGNIGKSAILYLEFIIPANEKYKKIIARILIGFVFFVIISLAVLIPLLSSADAVFAHSVKAVYDWATKIISLPFAKKLFFAAILSVIFLAAVITWEKEFDYNKKEKETFPIDSIIAGIVLGGILIVYLLFLWIQIGHLWVGSLPFDFKTTENLVKSGFWQLLVLTFLNIFIYFFIYKKTSLFVQKILLAFTAASLLLLVSAGYRMGLYVIFYGFSYEKFFASYTVLFCALLFFWLLLRLVVDKKTDILKTAVVLFIWMYGVMTVFPVEQFIFRSNIALSHREDSRIKLSELSMLSPDVLGLVKRYEAAGVLKKETFDWTPWIESQEKKVADKKWYERNAMNLLYLANKTETENNLVGGDKDVYGCIGSAGYSWCEAKQKCIRSWEEYCTITTPKKVVFACDGSKTITATFYIGDDKFVDLELSDGKKLSVPRAISASGARYTKADETFVFWNKGDTAFITEGADSVETYSNCNLQ
ncbi:MAG: DUF4173 domain-containing protein [Candidatus Pacebacteria bacterium]|nr:DUF4173 domain-containing protein [Candidatus Paceibacterota bacterium]